MLSKKATRLVRTVPLKVSHLAIPFKEELRHKYYSIKQEKFVYSFVLVLCIGSIDRPFSSAALTIKTL